jgi:hypothetical protein
MSQSETVTVKDMMELADVSKVTLLKIIAGAGLKPTGKLASGGRGRPALLFDRASFVAALAGRKTATVQDTVNRLAAIVAESEFVESPETVVDKAETDQDNVVAYTMSVDEINAALAD